jgi:hypothetical protein
LTFDGVIIGAQLLELPAPRPIQFPALGETLPAYEGELHATGVLRTRWSRPAEAKFLAGLFGRTAGPGPPPGQRHAALSSLQRLGLRASDGDRIRLAAAD